MLTFGFPFAVLTELDVIGAETIADDICPICQGNSRTRLLCEYIEKEAGMFDPPHKARVLHVAPEDSIRSRMKARKLIDYVGVDIEPAKYGRTDVTWCDITAINQPDESFDLIICSHVLEHIPDDGLAMRELFRILKPGGTAILQVPISASLPHTIEDPDLSDPMEREQRFGQWDHVRIYGADYVKRLCDAGFAVEVFDPVSRWSATRLAELRLNPREKIYLGRRGDVSTHD